MGEVRLRQRLGSRLQGTLSRRGYLLVRSPVEGSLERDIGRVIDQRNVDTMLDIGGHEGSYAQLWLSSGFSGRVVSFEPAQKTYDRLALRAQNRWEVHQAAIGAEDGHAEFYEYAEHDEFASLRRPAENPLLPNLTVRRTYDVQVRTLDSVVDELGIDPASAFIKIDTQGNDEAVLAGGPRTLAVAAGLQVEVPMFGLYEGAPTAEDLLGRVRGLGFDLVGMYPVHAHPRPIVPIEFDGLFVRAGQVPG